MATDRQKKAARRNIAKARQAQSARAHGANIPRRGEGMSTADENQLSGKEFAFPKERKEPLTDARHLRNAIARFNQLSGIPGTTGKLRCPGRWQEGSVGQRPVPGRGSCQRCRDS
jgi:uncharacterized protein DUF6582